MTILIQISKLRCFISLVCEQEPNGLKEDNFGKIIYDRLMMQYGNIFKKE